MVMFVVLVYLLYFIFMLLVTLFMQKTLVIVSIKVFFLNFIGDFELLFNIWSLLFLLMVILISTTVVIFSFSYMNGLSVVNFFVLYLSFIFSMLWLILNNNFYWMMLGWDGLGVVSFLLIVFYMNYESINNGLFTLFQNRIGDLFFILFMLGAINLLMINSLIIKMGVLFLIFGASVKSAQFPFNSWLLSAMSAPTPISSLVHSSTLVVAGVYILLQFSYCLSDALEVLKYVSLVTLLFSFLGLLNEMDMKKLIAYSTMSHVSLMLFMMSFKLYKVAYFHLNVHAMFKSLMFMCFGFVMLASYHSQDKRLVTLLYLNPVIKMIYYFSCMSLAGLPFMSAFFSKDIMIEKLMEISIEMMYVLMLLCFLAISIYYSLKLLQLGQVNFSYLLFEKSYLGVFSVMVMTLVMVCFINIFISIVFSLSLETFSNKMVIYLLMILFVFLMLMTNLNYKFISYNKLLNFKEVWFCDVNLLEKFIFWNMFSFLFYISSINKIKLFLLMNWWGLFLVVVLFYKKSF